MTYSSYLAEFIVTIPSVGPGTSRRNGTAIADSHLETTAELPLTFSKLDFDALNGKVLIEIDWADYCAAFHKSFDLEGLEWTEAIEALQKMPKGWNEAKLKCSVRAPKKSDQSNEVGNRIAAHYLEMLLSHIFLTANIASPGSFDLFRASFDVNPGESITFELHPYLAMSAYHQSLLRKWPSVERLSLARTWEWLKELGIGFHQIARNDTERALFALLHACDAQSLSPSSLLWLAHALEGLFQTPREGILESIKRRTLILFGEPPTHKKAFKKQVDEFYGLRSAFVHGTLDVCHPVENDLLDAQFDSYQTALSDAHDTAILIVIATLQTLVKNQWRSLSFQEQLRGLPASHGELHHA